MSTATTHIDNKPSLRGTKQSHPLAPALRFKEFEGEWSKEKAGELCGCIVPGRNKPKQFDGEIAWITTPDIVHNSYIYNSNRGLGISEEEAKSVGSKIAPKNSVIISCVGDLGLVAIAGIELVINQQLHAFLPSEKVEYRFLMYSITTQGRYIDRVATKTAVPYMNKNNCNSIPVYLPNYPEQQKIASFLSAVDKKIQQLTKKKALLEDYKKGVMQQLFSSTGSGHRSGQLRFKDDTSTSLGAGNGKAYPDWEEKRLGEIATKLSSNISANTIEENIGEYKIYGASGFLKKIDFFREEKPFISIVKDGAGVGRTLLCDANSSVLGTLDIIKPKSKVVLYFLYSVLNNIRFEKYMVGSTIPHIYYKDYSSERITIPCIEEQQKIAAYLSSIDTKIEAVKSQITQTQIFKKGLLQQLFV